MEKANLKTENLKKEVIKIFKNHGLSNPHAVISANALINAELVGAYGHGLSRLRMYCKRISKKVINPKPRIRVKRYLNRLLISMLIIVLASLQQISRLKKQSNVPKKQVLV